MSKILETCIIALIVSPVLGLAQIELSAVPTNVTIHVAEPVSLTVAVRNHGNSADSGFFILSGRYDGFSIEVHKIGEAKAHRFVNAVMWEATKDDMMFQPLLLNPGEEVSVNYGLLYNVRTGNYVFETDGEYDVHFRLRWSNHGGDTISVTTRVSVVEWDKVRDKEQLEALALWKNREIAAVFQDNAEMSSAASEKLRELSEKYTATVYGKLASALLARARTP